MGSKILFAEALSKSFPDAIKCCLISVLAPGGAGASGAGQRSPGGTEERHSTGWSRYKPDPKPQPALLFPVGNSGWEQLLSHLPRPSHLLLSRLSPPCSHLALGESFGSSFTPEEALRGF